MTWLDDVTQAEVVDQAVQRVVRQWEGLHLTGCYAVIPSPKDTFAETDLTVWSRVLNVNLIGMF